MVDWNKKITKLENTNASNPTGGIQNELRKSKFQMNEIITPKIQSLKQICTMTNQSGKYLANQIKRKKKKKIKNHYYQRLSREAHLITWRNY